MQDTNPIKYILIAKAEELKEIGEISIQASPEWIRDSKKIFENYCNNKIETKLEERNKVKIKDTNNSYFFTILENYIFCIAIAESTYSDTLIFKLFEDICKENIHLLRDSNGKLNSIGKSKMKDLVQTYQTGRGNSKLNDINKDLNEIKLEMKENVKNIVGNIDDAAELKNRSDKIADGAKQFQKDAAEVKKQACWQNLKWWIIIGVIVAIVIIIIVVAVVPKSSSSNNNSTSNNTSNANNTSTGSRLLEYIV